MGNQTLNLFLKEEGKWSHKSGGSQSVPVLILGEFLEDSTFITLSIDNLRHVSKSEWCIERDLTMHENPLEAVLLHLIIGVIPISRNLDIKQINSSYWSI